MGNLECSGLLDETKIKDSFKKKCFGNTNCVLDFGHEANNTNSFWKRADATCQDTDNFAFVQYACEMQEEEKFEKYNKVTLSTFCVLMIAVIFILCIWYLQHTVDLGGMQYDVSTIVASDYTVEMDITDDMWKEFEDNAYAAYLNLTPQETQLSKVLYFK